MELYCGGFILNYKKTIFYILVMLPSLRLSVLGGCKYSHLGLLLMTESNTQDCLRRNSRPLTTQVQSLLLTHSPNPSSELQGWGRERERERRKHNTHFTCARQLKEFYCQMVTMVNISSSYVKHKCALLWQQTTKHIFKTYGFYTHAK